MSFQNIPQEIKDYPQWVLWVYEERDDKRTKIPVMPDGSYASVTDKETWLDFETAITYSDQFSGIGFVLTENDPFAVIDLDNCEGNEQFIKWQEQIAEAFHSYSEVSPSGNGLHIVVKGGVPTGRRRNKVEIYSDLRYITFTGNVFRNDTINDCDELLNQLWRDMSKGRNGQIVSQYEDKPQTLPDTEIMRLASNAANGEKFSALYAGEWRNWNYNSQSDADFALIDIIAFYTQNRAQIVRIFHASQLGQRDKAKRVDYLEAMLLRAFDNQLPSVDLGELVLRVEREIAKQPEEMPTQQVIKNEKWQLSFPPGLIGDIASYVYETAYRPLPEVALASAIGLMSGVCGKAYVTTGKATGLNTYVLVLAETGSGKDALGSGINAMINACYNAGYINARDFKGPGKFASAAAITKFIDAGNKSFVSVVSEFGKKLKSFADSERNPIAAELQGLLMELYTRSGPNESVEATVYSNKDNNTKEARAVAFSWVGESTPSAFYSMISEELVADGFIPRFTILECDPNKKVRFNDGAAGKAPSPELVRRVGDLMAMTSQMNAAGNTQTVNHDADGAAELLRFRDECEDRRQKAKGRDYETQLWSRTHLKALRLASLVAVGINPYSPTVCINCARWAISLCRADANRIVMQFKDGEIGVVNGPEAVRIKEMKRIFSEYFTKPFEEVSKYGVTAGMHHGRIVPYMYLQKRLVNIKVFAADRRGSTKSIQETLQTLIDTGSIIKLSPAEVANYGASHARLYAVCNAKDIFN